MISSVIAKLAPDPTNRESTLHQIAAHPYLEVGELIENRMLPITIDAPDAFETETTTRWLQSHEGVEFVDVVFVHFED